MSSTSHRFIPFLSFPSEIRLAIYLAGWPDNAISSRKRHQNEAELHNQASQQLELVTTFPTFFRNLSRTCRQIRAELLHEFTVRVLPRTQFHLGSPYFSFEPSALAVTNNRIFRQLQASTFFAQHIQHVSLYWGGGCEPGCSRVETQARFQPQFELQNCLGWLATLPHLKTMELVFADPSYLGMRQCTTAPIEPQPEVPEEEELDPGEISEEEWGPEWGPPSDITGPVVFLQFMCIFCFADFVKLPASLEKIVFRVCCPENPEDEQHPGAVDESWEVTEWFHRARIEEAAADQSGLYRRFYGEVVDKSAVCSCLFFLSPFFLST